MKHLQTSLRWGTEMLRDMKKKEKIGKLNIDEEQSVKAVMNLIKENLKEFAAQHSDIKNEDGLTQNLSILLNQKALLFFFHFQYSEDTSKGNSPKVDLGILLKTVEYHNDKAFFLIEAKRLDSSIGKTREKEYVTGRLENNKYLDTGGIERFKKEIHGKTSIRYAALIGYVQTDNFSVWFDKVNGWISEQIKKPFSSSLRWGKQDKLVDQNESDVWAEYRSVHSRIESKDITLFHLWVNLTIK